MTARICSDMSRRSASRPSAGDRIERLALSPDAGVRLGEILHAVRVADLVLRAQRDASAAAGHVGAAGDRPDRIVVDRDAHEREARARQVGKHDLAPLALAEDSVRRGRRAGVVEQCRHFRRRACRTLAAEGTDRHHVDRGAACGRARARERRRPPPRRRTRGRREPAFLARRPPDAGRHPITAARRVAASARGTATAVPSRPRCPRRRHAAAGSGDANSRACRCRRATGPVSPAFRPACARRSHRRRGCEDRSRTSCRSKRHPT